MLIDNADVTDADAAAGAAAGGRGRIGFVCVVYSFAAQFRWFAGTHLLYYCQMKRFL